MSMPFACGEFLWYLRGSNRLEHIEYYSKMYPKFSDDKTTVNGAYGERIFGGSFSQWEQIKSILQKDPDSRQAVIAIYQPRDVFSSSVDIPCTCVLQYLIRDNALHCITYMRSNDIFLGMPYDIFSFTMLQELLSCELNVKLGTYTHMVGSLHIYEKNFNILDSIDTKIERLSYIMPQMTKNTIKPSQISLILDLEESLRENKNKCTNYNDIDPYWSNIIHILENKNEQSYGLKEENDRNK